MGQACFAKGVDPPAALQLRYSFIPSVMLKAVNHRPKAVCIGSHSRVSICQCMSRMQAAEEGRLSDAREALGDREGRAAAREAAVAEAAAAVDRRVEAVAEREAELQRLQGEVWTKVRTAQMLTSCTCMMCCNTRPLDHGNLDREAVTEKDIL